MSVRTFYAGEGRQKALRFHALELVGTPFAAHAMAPGVGIDCVHVNAWAYLKTGFLASFEPPAYSLDEGQHAKESNLLKWLDGNPGFKRMPIPECLPAIGDTVCFACGRAEFHVGLMLDFPLVVHVLAMVRGHVIVSDLVKEVYYKRRVRALYRPIEI